MRGWVCRLQLLLAVASSVILGPSPAGLVTIFYCLRFETSLFVAVLRWRYSTPPLKVILVLITELSTVP
jgi:hypothetical protein